MAVKYKGQGLSLGCSMLLVDKKSRHGYQIMHELKIVFPNAFIDSPLHFLNFGRKLAKPGENHAT